MQLSVAHPTPPRLPQNQKWWRSAMFTRSLLGLVAILNGYLIVQMYAQREYLFAMLTLLLAGTGIYLFASRKAYSWRYVYPGLVGMGLFVLFPLFCTIGIAFTNYSAVHQLSFERAQSVLLQRQFQSGNTLNFTLLGSDGHWQLQLQDADTNTNQILLSAPFALDSQPQRLTMTAQSGDSELPKAPLRVITKNRQALGKLTAVLPDGSELVMSSLRQFSAIKPLYSLQSDGQGLRNNQSGELYQPNNEIGFYQAVDAKGQWVADSKLSPGYTVTIGWDNFLRVLQDKGIQQPFIKIFIWTVLFAGLTVLFTLAVGMVLACLVQWPPLKGKAMYRLLLILPYAVPGFISILIFKGLFNQSFGEINMLLEQMFGLKPEWFTNPMLAKAMILIVNVWLGYPYMMILCMGLLKAIPDDLYEASALDGATPLQNFFRITLPLLIKPLTPLLIACFAFNFNNFVLIQLLTNGGPNMLGTSTPAGNTDLLVSYTYRIAFEGSGGQDFGLAAAIATLIFLLVGALAILNLKASKLSVEQ